MKNKRPLIKKYKKYVLTLYGPDNGEIEFLDESGFISLGEVDKVIQRHFPNYPREKLSFLISDETYRLTIGTTD